MAFTAAPELLSFLKCWEQNPLQPYNNFLLLPQQITTNCSLNNTHLQSYSSVGQMTPVSPGWNQGVSMAEFLRVLGEGPFPCFRHVGRIQFLKDIGWNSYPFPCWLSAKGCSQRLEVTTTPWLVAPSSFFKANSITTFWLFFHHHMITEVVFRDSCVYTGPTI